MLPAVFASRVQRSTPSRHKLVCTGTLSLDEAQVAIASDWIAAYQKYVEER